MGPLVVGSRAVRHAFPGARAALDWDVIATPDQAETLRRSLPLLAGVRSRAHDKVFLSCSGVPVEVIIAESGSIWIELLERPATAAVVSGLGAVRFARPSLLLAMKLGHAHLPMQWDKTADDIDALYTRRVRLDEGDASLVPRLRAISERWQNHTAVRSTAFHRVHALLRRRPMPTSANDKAALLAELTMLHAFHEGMTPDDAIRELVTRTLGREDAIALAPHARAAVRRIPDGYERRFSRFFSTTRIGTEIPVPWRST